MFSAETFPILVKHHIFWYNLGFPKPLIGNQVKHLLIILSILLLSSPLFAQETGLLYIWKNGTMYIGEWKDGKNHGQGIIEFTLVRPRQNI